VLAIQDLDLVGFLVFSAHFAVSMLRQSTQRNLSIPVELLRKAEPESEQAQWDVYVRLGDENASQQLLIGRHGSGIPLGPSCLRPAEKHADGQGFPTMRGRPSAELGSPILPAGEDNLKKYDGFELFSSKSINTALTSQ
jgi:hypothetical protein